MKEIACGKDGLIWAVAYLYHLYKFADYINEWIPMKGRYRYVEANYIGDVYGIGLDNKLHIIESKPIFY